MIILLCVNLILRFCYWLVFLPISWCGLFIASLVLTIWYVFVVAGTGCSFSCLVLPLEVLVMQVWWWWNLSVVACPQRILFLLHLWCLPWLDMKFWVESSFKDADIGPHSLLDCRVSAKRFSVSLMGFPLWVTRTFSLVALSIFSFILTLANLMIMCLGVALHFLRTFLWSSLYFLDLNVGLPC